MCIRDSHDIAIPFTRMLAGATDYHLGGFRALPRSEFKIQYVNPHVKMCIRDRFGIGLIIQCKRI